MWLPMDPETEMLRDAEIQNFKGPILFTFEVFLCDALIHKKICC